MVTQGFADAAPSCLFLGILKGLDLLGNGASVALGGKRSPADLGGGVPFKGKEQRKDGLQLLKMKRAIE